LGYIRWQQRSDVITTPRVGKVIFVILCFRKTESAPSINIGAQPWCKRRQRGRKLRHNGAQRKVDALHQQRLNPPTPGVTMRRMISDITQLRGLWHRSMIEWPDGRRDTTTAVRWLQGISCFGDLRQDTAQTGNSRARSLQQMSYEDCMQQASQQGFAGVLCLQAGCFEWRRMIDFQPVSALADAGFLHMQGDTLVERGRDVDYVEHWHHASPPSDVVAAASLRESAGGRLGMLLRVGRHFMYARDRAAPAIGNETLAQCVAAASTLAEAQALVDCEISFGEVEGGSFRIAASSLPYRVGAVLQPALHRGGTMTLERREWQIVEQEGELAALSPAASVPVQAG
jgi:hypothetical protein